MTTETGHQWIALFKCKNKLFQFNWFRGVHIPELQKLIESDW